MNKEEAGNWKTGRAASRWKTILPLIAAVAVPFFGIFAGTAGRAKFSGPGTASTRVFILSGIFSVLLYSAAGVFLVKERDAVMVRGCASSLSETGVLEEQYFISEGAYTESLDELAGVKQRLGAWMCEGMGAEKCARRFRRSIGKYCNMKSLEIYLNDKEGKYEIKARARNTGRCPICATPEGCGPADVEECRGINDFDCGLKNN